MLTQNFSKYLIFYTEDDVPVGKLWEKNMKEKKFCVLKINNKGVDPEPDSDSLVKGTDPDPHQNVTDPQQCFPHI
jgi:hypothetical protein